MVLNFVFYALPYQEKFYEIVLMAKQKILLMMIFIISLIVLVHCTRDTNTIAGYSIERETGTTPEYFVYSAILNSLKSQADAGFVLSDSTVFFNFHNDSSYIMMSFSELQEETFQSFQTANQQSIELLNIPDLNITCHLIHARYARSWKELFPNASALINVSGVGFNPPADQALVYVSKHVSPLSNTGFLIMLSRNNDGWTIVKSLILWTA